MAMPLLSVGMSVTGPNLRQRGERHVHAILAVGQVGARTGADADRLGLRRRQGHAARGVADHLQRGLFRGVRLGFLDRLKIAVLVHPPQLERDAVGFRLVAHVREDHFSAAVAIEHQACRSDQQVALRDAGARRQQGKTGDAGDRRFPYGMQKLTIATHLAVPPLGLSAYGKARKNRGSAYSRRVNSA